MKCKLSFRVRGIASSEVKCDEHIGATSDPNSAVPVTTKKTFFEVSYVAIVKEPKSAIAAVQRVSGWFPRHGRVRHKASLGRAPYSWTGNDHRPKQVTSRGHACDCEKTPPFPAQSLWSRCALQS